MNKKEIYKDIKLPKITFDGTSLTGEEGKKDRKIAIAIAKKIQRDLPQIINEDFNWVDDENLWAEDVWGMFSSQLTKEERKWLDKNPAWIRECIFSDCSLPQNILADVGRELLCTNINW